MAATDREPSTIKAQAQGIVKALDPEPGAYRLELDEFVQNEPALNLFLLALESLQNNDVITKVKNDWKNANTDDEKKKWEKELSNNERYWWSYFSLASIHGLPKQPWRHKHVTEGDAWYCQHGSRIFPTWHRPYVMMFEQSVFNEMYRIAKMYPENADKECSRTYYLTAAKSFRLPYWDPWMPRYSSNGSEGSTNGGGTWFGLPAILKAQEVFVRRPEKPNDLVEIDNPLYHYKVPRHRDLLSEATVGWTDFYQAAEGLDFHTIRNPSSQRSRKNNDVVLEYQLRTQRLGQAGKLWQLLVNMADLKDGWDVFACDTATGATPEVSLESWHDDIHNLVGSGRNAKGSMGLLPQAGFDPVFWLHHNNVDRLLALYQVLHPDQYVPAKAADGPTIDTPLKPFYKSAGSEDKDFWTSADAEDWAQCAYAIPGTDRNADKDALKKLAADYIRDTYLWISYPGASPPATLPFPKNMDSVEALIGLALTPPPQQIGIKAASTQNGGLSLVDRSVAVKPGSDVASDKKTTTVDVKDHLNLHRFPQQIIKEKGHITWNAHLTVKKYAFHGSFNVNFFFGPVDDGLATDFTLLNNQIGFTGIFAASPADECMNCQIQSAASILYADAVPLTSELTKYLKSDTVNVGVPDHLRILKSLNPEDVVPVLKENLNWRITTPSGELKTRDAVRDSGLEIKIVSRWYNMPSADNGLGSYNAPILHASITQGKVGGFSG
ncbi:MAG: hypothetical protein Q9167_002513 [Letrouitia subvulpina]